MEGVRPRLGGGVNLAGPTTKFSSVGIGLHFEFLNLIDRGHRRKGVEIRLYIGCSVEQKVRVLSASASNRILKILTAAHLADFLKRFGAAFRERYSWGQCCQIQKETAI